MAVSLAQHPATIDSVFKEAMSLKKLEMAWDENTTVDSLFKQYTSLREPLDIKTLGIIIPVRSPLQPTMSNNASLTPLPTPKAPLKKRKRAVQFDKREVTGVSRPPTSTEHWTLYYFEAHTITCKACKSANKHLSATKGAEGMCGEGSELAEDVAELDLSVLDDGNVYCIGEGENAKKKGKGLQVRVEIPHNYRYSKKLIRCKEGKDEVKA